MRLAPNTLIKFNIEVVHRTKAKVYINFLASLALSSSRAIPRERRKQATQDASAQAARIFLSASQAKSESPNNSKRL
jgi:hypothetical protein